LLVRTSYETAWPTRRSRACTRRAWCIQLTHCPNLIAGIGEGLTVWATHGYVLAPGPKGSAVLVARLLTPEEYRVTPHDGGAALVRVSDVQTIAGSR
jgi:hypothetical protein